MQSIGKVEAAERVAAFAEKASPDQLHMIFQELFPTDTPPPGGPKASELARYIRTEAEFELVIDLWNLFYPDSRVEYFDEETETLRYEVQDPRYADH